MGMAAAGALYGVADAAGQYIAAYRSGSAEPAFRRPENGVFGLDDNGSEYRLLPYDLAGNVRDECVFLDFAALQRLGRRPENAAVWAVVENTAQFVQVQDCDGVIWQIADRHSAEALSALLVQGVSLPVAAYAPRDYLRHYVQSWLDLGLHVQIENREYEMV